MDIEKFFHAVVSQDAEKIRGFFMPDALVYWHNTNECFSVEDFIRAHCDYPGKWQGELERLEYAEAVLIVITKVWNKEGAFRAVSFIELGTDDKISRLDEYWGDIAQAPEWRNGYAKIIENV